MRQGRPPGSPGARGSTQPCYVLASPRQGRPNGSPGQGQHTALLRPRLTQAGPAKWLPGARGSTQPCYVLALASPHPGRAGHLAPRARGSTQPCYVLALASPHPGRAGHLAPRGQGQHTALLRPRPGLASPRQGRPPGSPGPGAAHSLVTSSPWPRLTQAGPATWLPGPRGSTQPCYVLALASPHPGRAGHLAPRAQGQHTALLGPRPGLASPRQGRPPGSPGPGAAHSLVRPSPWPRLTQAGPATWLPGARGSTQPCQALALASPHPGRAGQMAPRGQGQHTALLGPRPGLASPRQGRPPGSPGPGAAHSLVRPSPWPRLTQAGPAKWLPGARGSTQPC
ncbi:translation initiation factor IF-2-like [Eriocheir sinensis]|uniref:translation initiation factor IF-2-like n=1 Tax=Eriocheir sinensis TaxID=95602 RepID=UPI0021C65952|nr:translation initiation factor IF-2-like [Eriocheir sinensis]